MFFLSTAPACCTPSRPYFASLFSYFCYHKKFPTTLHLQVPIEPEWLVSLHKSQQAFGEDLFSHLSK